MVPMRTDGVTQSSSAYLNHSGMDVVKYAAKICGGYGSYYKLLMDKQTLRGMLHQLEATIGLVDSFDGAEYVNTDEGTTSVLSYRTLSMCRQPYVGCRIVVHACRRFLCHLYLCWTKTTEIHSCKIKSIVV